MSVRNPKTTHFEFFGPPGVTFVSSVVPITIYGLYFTCSETSGCSPSLASLPARFIQSISNIGWLKSLFDADAAIAYFAWYASLVAAWYFLPGEWVEGTELRVGGRKKYKINAFPTLLLNLGLVASLILAYGPEGFTFIYDHWVGICTAAIINSFIQATYCYVMSTWNEESRLLALGGNTGNAIYDWFIGRELNPSIGSLDLKTFNELRPALILWLLCNISSACKQLTYRGTWLPTDSMVLVLLFQGLYVIDGIYNERALFTTMDVMTEGFGFMLSVGDLAWVPLTYSLQARYLAFNHIELGPFWTSVIFAVHALGFWIFRDSNNEKNNFRNGRNPKNLKSFKTERGTRLLTSGWWGMCQHPNYLGDWIMGVSWSLPTGFNTPITYFYCIFFLILLVHRQRRDDEVCQKKYGKDWQTYKRLVPWKILPYVY